MEWIQYFISWYFYMLVIGLIFFPISRRLFPKAIDQGYAFSKAIGLIILTYLTLLLGITRLMPFGRIGIVAILIVFAYILYRRVVTQKDLDVVGWLQKNSNLIRWILLEEVIFFGGLLLWTLVRGQEPTIRGLEKFMDYGFMQSILRSKYFPPLDMWYSIDTDVKPIGYFINYYYFGHLSGALLTKLTDIPSQITYNLILANILGMSLSMTFGIVINIIAFVQNAVYGLKRAINNTKLALYGLLGMVVLNFAGNWHTIYLFTRGYENESPLPPWAVLPNLGEMFKLIGTKFPNVLGALGEYSKYWYPNATRFIPKTIHEFPSYSYVVADLHGHVFDIPFVLLTIAIIFLIFMPMIVNKWAKYFGVKGEDNDKSKDKTQLQDVDDSQSNTRNKWLRLLGDGFLARLIAKTMHYNIFLSFILGFLMAVHYMTNAFDGPIYILLALVILLVLYGLTVNFFVNVVVLIFGFIYFSLPFSVFFEPFVSGIGVNCGYPIMESLKRTNAAIYKLGPFLFEKDNCQRSDAYQMIILWGFFWLFAVILALIFFLTRKYLKVLKDHAKEENRLLPYDFFFGIIFLFGTGLLIIPEFFYIKDIYPTHFRANTIFKMGYQAYMLMSICSVYVLWRISTLPKMYQTLKRSLLIVSSISFFLVLIYMNFAVQSYYGSFNRPVKLDGIAWLKDQQLDVYEIVEYFNKNIVDQPTILEAQGDSYTDYNAISAYTGIPTVAGWWVHEWLWRGSADVVGSRIPFIEKMYQSNDIDETRKLLRRFKVEYVVIASNERKKYDVGDKSINEKKFTTLGTEVFRTSDGKGVVYKIR